MNLPVCCICREHVLELRGQFTRLVPSLLLPEDDDMRAAGAFGTCHLTCLRASGWGPRWAERRENHARYVRRLAVVGRRDSVIGFRNPLMHETILYWADGNVTVVGDDQLDRVEPAEGGVLLSIEEEYNLELSPNQLLVEDIRHKLVVNGRYPLPELVEALGIAHRMADGRALSRGALLLNSELRALWQDAWVSARVAYTEFVPQEGFLLALEGAGR